MDFLSPLFFFVLAICIVVGFHEYGHFLAARLSGVKVDVFSIGMGPKVFAKTSQRSGITYQLSALPIGGYVKMWESSSLKDQLEREPTESELTQCFDKTTLPRRFFIVANGPFFNFVLAVIGYTIISYSMTIEPKPVIGNLLPGSIMEESGFRTGDELLSINGKPVKDWESVSLSLAISSGGLSSLPVSVVRNDQETTIELPLVDARVSRDEHVFEVFGFYPIHASGSNQVTYVAPGSAAENLGLVPNDTIVSFGSCTTPNLRSLIHCLEQHDKTQVDVKFVRDGAVRILSGPWEPGESLGINTQSIAESHHFIEDPKTVLNAAVDGLSRTVGVTSYTVESVYKLLTGQLSPELVGGPVTLAKAADSSATHGHLTFIGFLCIFSISLMILNLLPIPPLDGGLLFLNLVEAATNESIAEKMGGVLSRVGVILIGLLMVFAIGNDIFYEIF